MPRPFLYMVSLVFSFTPLLSYSQEIWINTQAQTWVLNPQIAPVSFLGAGGKVGLEWENFLLPNLSGGVFVSSNYFIPSTTQGTLWTFYALGSLTYAWHLIPFQSFGPYVQGGYGLGMVSYPKKKPSNFGAQILGTGGLQYQYFFNSRFSLGLAMGANGIFESQGSYFNFEINLMARLRLSGSKKEPQIKFNR